MQCLWNIWINHTEPERFLDFIFYSHASVRPFGLFCWPKWQIFQPFDLLQLVKSLPFHILLVFSVTPFKIDHNKNQNRSIDKVQNLGNERRYIYKDSRQDSGQRNISHTSYRKKCFTQTYRDLYGRNAGAHLDGLRYGGRKPRETSVTEFCYKSVNLFFEKLINIKVILFFIHEQFR